MKRAWTVVVALGACVPPNNNPVANTLVRIDQELPGENCEYGGLAIHTGRDTNLNGDVDDPEILTTSYVCNGPPEAGCADPNAPTGVVVVQTPADMAALAGVTCIDGDLIIAGYPDATFAPLDLEQVTGSITIAGNATLSTLDGFAQLTKVRTFSIQGNDQLSDISSVGQLSQISALMITGNDALLDLSGLDTWMELRPNLTVSNNASLTSLHGLENVQFALQQIHIKDNPALQSLSPLGPVKIIGLIDISGNISLPTIDLPELQKINVTFSASANAALTTVSIPKLSTASGLTFSSNPLLQTIELDELAVANSLSLAADSELVTFPAPNLAAITGHLDLPVLPAPTTVELQNLQSIGGWLYMQAMPSLSALSGLSSLRKVSGDLTVHTCDGLMSFAGLGDLQQIAGSLLVQNNAGLTSFTGMQGSLTTIGGNLSILSNTQLAAGTAQSFAGSVTVGGTVTIN